MFYRSALYLSLICFSAEVRAQPAPSDTSSQVVNSGFRKITTIAGNGKTGQPVQKGRALDVPLSNPFGIQPESDGSLIIASYDQHVIYRLDPTYRRLERIAGNGTKGFSGKDGDLPLQVAMNQPHEVQVDADGNIFIADTMNHRVGMIEADTGRWKTVAGSGQPGFSGDGGPAKEAELKQAYSIIVDGQDLFIADLQNQRIRKVRLRNGVIETLCGNGTKEMPTHGGAAISQPLAGPRSLAADPDNLWIVLREGNSVWRIDRNDGRIYHVAGTGEKGFSGDGGPAKKATFAGPKGITVDPGVALYIADTENHAIRRVDLENGLISTVIGKSGKPGFDGDGDEIQNRQLSRPHGVCLLPGGELLIGDSENHRVRMLTP